MKLKSGSLLRAMIDTKGTTQSDVAAYARCSRAFISALATERKTSCTTQVAGRIAEFLTVPVEVLFDPKTSAVSGDSSKTQQRVA